MSNTLTRFYNTAIWGVGVVASGSLQHVITTVKDTLDNRDHTELLIFDDFTGKPVDVDFRRKTDDVLKRLGEQFGNLPGTEV